MEYDVRVYHEYCTTYRVEAASIAEAAELASALDDNTPFPPPADTDSDYVGGTTTVVAWWDEQREYHEETV